MKRILFFILLFCGIANAQIAERGTISGSVISLKEQNFKKYANSTTFIYKIVGDDSQWEIAYCTFDSVNYQLTVGALIANSSNTTSALTFTSYNGATGVTTPVIVTYNTNPINYAASANVTQQCLGFAANRTTSPATTTGQVLVNIPNMSFNIGANEVWVFHFYLLTGSSSVAGIKIGFTYPAGATGTAKIEGTTSGLGTFISEAIPASGVATTNAYNTVVSQTGWIDVTGFIINGSTAGTIQEQALKVTSGTATALANSYFTAQKIN